MTTKMVMIMMIAMMADKGTTISCLPASLSRNNYDYNDNKDGDDNDDSNGG